jgi:hypothetical protein
MRYRSTVTVVGAKAVSRQLTRVVTGRLWLASSKHNFCSGRSQALAVARIERILLAASKSMEQALLRMLRLQCQQRRWRAHAMAAHGTTIGRNEGACFRHVSDIDETDQRPVKPHTRLIMMLSCGGKKADEALLITLRHH